MFTTYRDSLVIQKDYLFDLFFVAKYGLASHTSGRIDIASTLEIDTLVHANYQFYRKS